MLYRGFDAAYPPQEPPPGRRVVLGYIGGATEHVWTLQEWLRFRALRQFPCWVADLGADPVSQARQACQTAEHMGWYRDRTRALICDTEAASDRGWYQSWAAELTRLGYLEANYGSAGAPGSPIVEANGSHRIWAAAWDDDPILEGGQLVLAHQYEAGVPFAGTAIDLSVVSHEMLLLGGGGPRRAQP